MEEDVLVLGAGFAGINTSLRLSRKGFEVTLVDMNSSHEFTPGIIDLFGDRITEKSLSLDMEEFLDGTGIQFEQELVEGINPDKEVVHTGSGDYHYDYLVVALGGDVKTNGVDISEAVTVYSIEDAKRIREQIGDVDEVLVVGAGYTGIEAATELRLQGLGVTVVDKSTRPMPCSTEEVSHTVLDYMNEKGIKFRGGKKVVDVTENGVETEEDEINADMVVWAGGIRSSKVVRDSFDTDSGLPVNAGLSSEEYSNVFAAGDCADTDALNTAQNAEKQGRLIAENMLKREDESLEGYEPGKELLVVSMGDTGMLVHGDRVFKNRSFRFLKKLIRRMYFLRLSYEKMRIRVSRIFG